MKRWLPLSLGLAIVATALYLMARGGGDRPLDDIDDASRAKLERVLGEAQR